MSFTPFIDLLVSLLCPHPQSSKTTNQSSQPQDETATRASSGSFASTSQTNGLSKQQHNSANPQGNSSATASETAVPAGTVRGAAATAEGGAAPGKRSEDSPWQALFALHEHSTAYRACLVQVLRGKDAQLICAAVRALAAVVQSKAASAQVLASAGQSLPSLCSRRLHSCWEHPASCTCWCACRAVTMSQPVRLPVADCQSRCNVHHQVAVKQMLLFSDCPNYWGCGS